MSPSVDDVMMTGHNWQVYMAVSLTSSWAGWSMQDELVSGWQCINVQFHQAMLEVFQRNKSPCMQCLTFAEVHKQLDNNELVRSTLSALRLHCMSNQ